MIYQDGERVLFATSDGMRMIGVVKIVYHHKFGRSLVIMKDDHLFGFGEIKIIGKVDKEDKLIE